MITVAILTISDSAAAGTRLDASGPALSERCQEIGWQVCAAQVVPDDQLQISDCLRQWADQPVASLILTTGGTGIAKRDNTPEATRSVLDREVHGISELLRAKGLEQTRFSALSRSVAGIRGTSLIVNLPGSPKGALFSLEILKDLVPHAIRLLQGDTEHITK